MKRIALVFLLLLNVCVSVSNGFAQTTTFTDNLKDFSIPIIVSSKKEGFIKNLSPKDIEIFENDNPVKLVSLAQSADPFVVGLFIDMSGSSSNGRYAVSPAPACRHPRGPPW